MKTFNYSIIIILLFIFLIGCNSGKPEKSIKYAPFSKSVVHINLKEKFSDTVFVEASSVTIIHEVRNKSDIISIHDKDDYYLQLEVDRPAKSSLKLGDSLNNIVTFPNDTTHIELSNKNGKLTLSFYGRGKKINKYYQEKRDSLGYSDVRYPLNEYLTSRATYNSIKNITDSIVNRELDFFNKYTSSNNLPKWFLNYEKAEIVYRGAGFKAMLPHYNKIFQTFDDSLPSNYFDYIKEVKINNPKARFSSGYIQFLDTYFSSNLPVKEFHYLSGKDKISKLTTHDLKRSKQQLSGIAEEIFKKNMFAEEIKYYSDTTAIDSLAKKYQITDYQKSISLLGEHKNKKVEGLNLSKGDTIPEVFLTNVKDSVVSLRDYADKHIYINFWATWCGPCIKNFPALNKMIKAYSNKSNKIVFFNICRDSEKDNWLKMIDKHNLRGINLLAEGKWNQKLKSIFNISGIPHYVILSRGNTIFRNHDNKAPKVKEKLETLLAKDG